MKILRKHVKALRAGQIVDPICPDTTETCGPKCVLYTGTMDGRCCRGLHVAATRQFAMYVRGGCDRKAMRKRLETLADYLERVLETVT